MFIVVSCSLIAILLTYLNSIDRLKNGMFIGFCLVTFLAIIHYDYGNDYMSYYSVYWEISNFDSISQVLNMEVYREHGWSVLNYIFRYFGGFFGLVAVISLFEGIVYYKAIKRYLPKNLWVLGVFLYLIRTSFYLLNFSMLRQGLAISVFLALWPWIEKKKWIPCLIIMYLASTIHSSALILIPFCFWGFLPVKNTRIIAYLLLALLIALSFSSSLLIAVSDTVLEASESFEQYTLTYGKGGTGFQFGVGVLIYMIPTIVTWYYLAYRAQTEECKRMAALSMVGTLITPFTSILPMVGRMGFYFTVYSIFVLPLAYMSIKNKALRVSLLSLYCLIVTYDYYVFFTSDVFSERYQTFHTIFSQF